MPIPASLGPYHIKSLLGQGGMGAVYHAVHEITAAEVAIKVVSVPSSAGIAAIRREIHALGRVRHSGVVQVVDQGIANGLPWYAMELVRGKTFRALLQNKTADENADTLSATDAAAHANTFASSDTSSHPNASSTGNLAPRATSNRALDICVELCEPLAVVHAAGLVHRDLKPENILVTSNGFPVLVDFGLAAGFGGTAGREVLAAAGDVMGTVSYMAPEQIRGDLVDARADLYALGCVLYECLTAQTPFAGHDRYGVLQAHLFDAPIPPSQRRPDISADLDALVLQLLAKRPADRIGYAADVAATLRRLGYGLRAAPEIQAKPYLYRAELIGRASSMERATAAMDALARGRGSLLYVGGESGVGKTRLGVEITREAALRQMPVVTGQCLVAGREGREAATPLHPFLPLLHEALLHALDHQDAALLATHARGLTPYLPDLAPHFAHLPEPARLAPDAARARVLDAAVAVILALIKAKPRLLVLDDLQWADELSLALLGRLETANLAAHGLLCVGFYRVEEARDSLLALARSANVDHWVLTRLDQGNVAEMAAGMLGTPRVPRAWADLLARVSGGNPFFAGEYLRAAVDAGILLRDARGRWALKAADAARGEALALPSTIEALLEARFAQLGAVELRLLAGAAVLGRSVEAELAAATANIAEQLTLDAISALVQRQILEEADGGQLRFVHDRLREAAYARIAADDRRALHGAAAASIEARHPYDPAQFARLASHHAEAEHHAAAYWYATMAAEQAVTVYAAEQTIALHRAALVAAGSGGAANERFADTWTKLGDALHQAGRADEAHDAYTRALAYVDVSAREERAKLQLAGGKTWETRQQNPEALAAYAEAERSLGAAPSTSDDAAWWRTWIQIRLERIAIHYFSGDNDALNQVVDELGPLVERRGTEAQKARFFQSLVQRDLRGARYRTSPATVAYAQQSLAAFVAGSDRTMATDARFTLAAVLLWNDALDAAVDEMLTALEEAEATGNAILQVLCLSYLSVIGRRRHDVDSTRLYSFRCMSAAEAAKMPRYVGVAEANLGWVQRMEGKADEAERLCREALTRWRSVSLAFPFEWLARFPLLELAEKAGRFAEAAEHAQAILAPAQQHLPEALTKALEKSDLVESLHIAERLGFL